MAAARNSVFDDWYARARVRTGDRHVVSRDDLTRGEVFSEQLVPVLSHRLVRERGEALRRELLVRALYGYFAFTTQLEHRVVNVVASAIAHGEIGVAVPAGMRLDAHRLYCDEAYHALFSADIIEQVVALTGIACEPETRVESLQVLEAIISDVASEDRMMARVLFACVSETLITRTLVDLPQDQRVVEPVRAIVLDHARDEARHQRYFSELFAVVWPALPREVQERLGPLLPRFIELFLSSSDASARRSLAHYGFAPRTVEQILAEVGAGAPSVAVGRTAAPTVKLFERCGVFASPATRDAFAAADLLTC